MGFKAFAGHFSGSDNPIVVLTAEHFDGLEMFLIIDDQRRLSWTRGDIIFDYFIDVDDEDAVNTAIDNWDDGLS